MNRQKEPFIGSIQELCRKNNCECLFIKKPLPANYNNYFTYFLAFEEYSRENNLPFLFMNRIIDEINLDFEKEFADLSHLNWNVQKKLSLFLGKYLQENYHIENKKGKPGYERFDQDYEKMMYYINNYSELSD